MRQDGTELECRAILDSGSQVNLITKKLAQKLNIKIAKEALSIKGIGQGQQNTHQRVNVHIASRITAFSTNLEAYVLPKLTDYQPTKRLDISTWAIPNNISLADPTFNSPQPIDLLIGAGNYYELISIGQIKLGTELPTLQNTVFGWIVSGKIGNLEPTELHCGTCTLDDKNLDEKLERFWKLEETENITTQITMAESKCENHFNQTVKTDPTGRFVVKLPFIKDPSELGESKDIALARFRSIERKLKANPELKKQYEDFMNEYISLGPMEEFNTANITPPYSFLPHHCMLKPDSITTKLRVVFDGSAKSSTNVSLNEILHNGPKLQEDLFSILLRFRMPRYVFTADIEKMYRQVLVHPEDRRFQLIWWRQDESTSLKCYILNTVTYAPYLAIKCLQRLSQQNAGRYPLGSECIKRDFYVGDLMLGSNSLKEAQMMQDQISHILKSAGLNLRKWCSNHSALLKNIEKDDKAPQLEINDEDCSIKTLGLIWHPKTDDFEITTVQNKNDNKITKRKILAEIAQLFDPLGLISPVVITAKILFQQLWTLKLDWNAIVPMAIHTQWLKFRAGLNMLNKVKMPRHVIGNSNAFSIQIHAFCDVSEKAYGAAIYVRSENQDGVIRVRLLCAKSRVAPIETVTPRLELCGAKFTITSSGER